MWTAKAGRLALSAVLLPDIDCWDPSEFCCGAEVDRSKALFCTLDKIEATRASHGPDEIKKYASVVILQIGQVVGEVGEIVADASLQVLANAMIDRGQRAAAALI